MRKKNKLLNRMKRALKPWLCKSCFSVKGSRIKRDHHYSISI